MHAGVEEQVIQNAMSRTSHVPPSRLAFLFLLFFVICCGLGYPILNRIDWRTAPGGLQDLQKYAGMVTGQPIVDVSNHTRYRVLVPYLAKPFYRLAENHVGTWDPIMFSLLIVNSLLVAATVTVLLVVVERELGSYIFGLGAAFIYLLNFAVPNLRLVGFIDAGEGFFLMVLVWSLVVERYWLLPVLGILGAATKESFVPYLVIFSFTWWVCSRKTLGEPRLKALWMVSSWIAALLSLVAVQRAVTGVYRSPLRFGLELRGDSAYLSHFLHSLADRNLWYIFVWLLPLSLVRLRRFPRNWKLATAAATVTAFAMDGYYGSPPGAIGRTLFSVAGPLLSASVAMLLFGNNRAEAINRKSI
jgi:hypothetical protein